MTAENRGWPDLLGAITVAKREIQHHTGELIDVAELPELCLIVSEVFRTDNTTYGGETLPINPTLLTSLRDRSGSITRNDAQSVVDEIRLYFRGREEEVYNTEPAPIPNLTGGAFGQGAFGEFPFGGHANSPTDPAGPINSEPLNNSTLSSGPQGLTAGGPIGTSGVDLIAPTASTSPVIIFTNNGITSGAAAIVQTKEIVSGRITTIIVESETWVTVPNNRRV